LDDRRFRVSDLVRWAEEGLISSKQARNILREEGLDDTGSALPGAAAGRGLNVITLFSYFGAFLALTGLAVFAAVNWNDLAPATRVVMTLSVMLALLAAGYRLRSRTVYRLGGNLLFLLGTALVPVTLFALGAAFGSADSEGFLSKDDLPGATALVALSIVLTTLLILLGRVPQATLVPAGLLAVLGALAAAWTFGTDQPKEIWLAVMGVGACLVVVRVGLYGLKEREYSYWAGATGHFTFYLAITALL
jgi:hypothetical protein